MTKNCALKWAFEAQRLLIFSKIICFKAKIEIILIKT